LQGGGGGRGGGTRTHERELEPNIDYTVSGYQLDRLWGLKCAF
jgi:hypothetical protein